MYSSIYNNQSPDKQEKRHKNLLDLTDGIVGIRNISHYCYLNALMQCMVPIDEMRNHYLT